MIYSGNPIKLVLVLYIYVDEHWQRRKNANASAAQTNAERLSKIIG
jgi:hypothetical protein